MAGTLSCVLRFHDYAHLNILDLALASLGAQSFRAIELIIVGQNLTADQKAILENKAATLFKKTLPERSVKVVDLPNPEKKDLRSAALNLGLRNCMGSYLAFLDFDDVLEPDAYQFLTTKLIANPQAALASGKCLVEFGTLRSGRFDSSDELEPFSWGRTLADFYSENFLPIHSFVLNRSNIETADLYFDEDMDLSEDYAFLLRLSSKYTFDFSGHPTLVARYRCFENRPSSNPSLAKGELTAKQNEQRKQTEARLAAIKNSLGIKSPNFSELSPRPSRISPLRSVVTKKLRQFPSIRDKVVSMAGLFGIKPRKF
jgi:glycosyltransferase involved in cell wall biosynthesis